MKTVRMGLLVAALMALPIGAVSEGPDMPDLRHEVLRTWTTEPGLPQNFITCIQQTDDGFLWVGTYGGLTRFDGLHFRSKEPGEPAELGSRIAGLQVDRNGALWIATPAGLFRRDASGFHKVALEGLADTTVEQLLSAADGDGVWLRTTRGLLRVRTNGAHAVALPLGARAIRAFTQDRAGSLWIADDATVWSVSESGVTARYPLRSTQLLYTAPGGAIYAGDGHQLFFFDQGRGHFVLEPNHGPGDFVRMLVDRRGRLWMASGGLQGITRYSNGRLESLNLQQGLASNDARVLFEDRDGDMWIGTISGLQRLHQGLFTSYTEADGLPGGRAQYDAIFSDREGAIWAGTLQSGIVRFDGQRWQRLGVGAGLKPGQVRGFAEGEGAPLVAVADYGLFASSQKNRTRYSKMSAVPPGYVTSPVRTQDGSLWYSVLQKGVCRLQQGIQTCFGAADGLTDEVVWALAPGTGNDLWAGAKTGAFHWDGVRWSRQAGVHAPVHAIALARDGGIFLGTSSGILYQRGEKTWAIRQQDDSDDNPPLHGIVLALQEDSQGNLWAATAQGICRVAAAQLRELISGHRARVAPELFSEEDGLRSGQVLPIAQVLSTRGRDGRIWFATGAGPAVVNDREPAPMVAKAVIDELTVDEQRLPIQSTTVEPGRHRLLFSFTAPSFVAADRMRFRYRLIGWDSGWIEGGTLREVAYMGLPPGTYTFQVQAIGRTGEGGPVSDGIAIRLRPFFWQTRSFYLLMIVLVAAVVAAITRQRTLQRTERLNLRFQERSAERERIAAQIHDTFVQDLTGTALQLELVGLQYEEDPIQAQASLRLLTHRIGEMIARSRDIVSNLHAMAGPGETLLDLLRAIEGEFRLGPLPRYDLMAEGQPPELHPFLRDELYRICREAVANAFRHANARLVRVRLRSEPAALSVSVCDDGAGMTEGIRLQGRPGHFGLSGMQAHAQRIGARLRVESAVGCGTCVVVEVPTHKLRTRLLRAGSWKQRFITRAQAIATLEREETHD